MYKYGKDGYIKGPVSRVCLSTISGAQLRTVFEKFFDWVKISVKNKYVPGQRFRGQFCWRSH